jgi:uncharacterized membrane protein YfcA
LIGVGGGEFRLPLLLLLFGISARAGVPMNLVISLITLVGAFAVRATTLSTESLHDFDMAIHGLMLGALAGAFAAPSVLRRFSDRGFERMLAVLLLGIAAILILEAFVPVVPVGLVDGESWAGLASGIVLGALIGAIAALLGVAGGEFLIPTLILVYGADAATAGTGSLAISIVAVTAGLVRYRALKMLPSRGELRRIALPMGFASVVGAVPGGMLAAAAPDTTLKLILGAILIAAAAKTLQHTQRTA